MEAVEQVRPVSRRTFIVTATAAVGGMAIGIGLPGFAQAKADSSTRPVDFTPWLTIAPDGTVTVRVTMPETGNGVTTQAVMLVAEELNCDWSTLRMEYVTPTRNYLDGNGFAPGGLQWWTFFGGASLEPTRMQTYLQVAASARERLKAAAATRWRVLAAEIQAKNSTLIHVPTGRSLRYGEVAKAAAEVKFKVEPTPKPQSEWTLLGKTSARRLNNAAIVNGSNTYGIDVRLPDMLYAAIALSPVQGGRLKRCDRDAVKNMPGVRAVVVIDPDEPRPPLPTKLQNPLGMAASTAESAIAVIADHYWQARKALEALPLEWDGGAGAGWKTTEQLYEATAARLGEPAEAVERHAGDDAAVPTAQPKLVEATYRNPICDQAPLEPLNGTALVTADRAEIWVPVNDAQTAYTVAVHEAGLAPEKVHLHQTFVGGSFGRRNQCDDVRLVVAVARKFPGRPVKVIWSREEALRHGRYRPHQVMQLKAGLNDSGMPQTVTIHRIAHGPYPSPERAPMGLSDSPYFNGGIANVRIGTSGLPFHVGTGSFRGPGYNTLVFFVESFIDECAASAGIDPLDYRLRLLAHWPDKGWANVLHTLATKTQWGKPLPKGQAQGIAISNWGTLTVPQPHVGTTIGVVAHVEVSQAGKLRIHQVDIAFDCGQVMNRDGARAQIEGSTLFGLNVALNEALSIKDGRIVEGNFDEYPMLRMGDVPPINVHFDAVSGHDRRGSLGECGVGPIGPAIANAIYRATGKRLRTTPFRQADLKWT